MGNSRQIAFSRTFLDSAVELRNVIIDEVLPPPVTFPYYLPDNIRRRIDESVASWLRVHDGSAIQTWSYNELMDACLRDDIIVTEFGGEIGRRKEVCQQVPIAQLHALFERGYINDTIRDHELNRRMQELQ